MAEQETAREQGWVPQEEWKGDPDKWVDAETFVKRGEEILPIVNARLAKEREKVEALTGKIAAISEDAKAFREFQRAAADRTKQEYEAKIADLKERRSEALSQGDGKMVTAIEEQIERTPKPELPPPQASPQDQAILDAWVGENTWYQSNAKLRRYADATGLEYAGKLTGKAFLDKVAEEVKEAFPSEFKNTNRTRTDVDVGTGAPAPASGRTYKDLPPDAKEACDRFVGMKWLTREQYLADYFGDES